MSIIGQASRLAFDAMAPVLMVHGIRAGPGLEYQTGAQLPDWFEDYRHAPAGPNAFQNSWFRQPFKDGKIPNKSLTFDEGLLIDRGGAEVLGQIVKAADEFGSKYCHLVGHSKGGLWSRKSIELLGRNANIGVYSLTSVDTPHHGTYNAVVRELVRTSGVMNLSVEEIALWLGGPYSPAIRDLTPGEVFRFNLTNFLRICLPPQKCGKWAFFEACEILRDKSPRSGYRRDG